MPAIEVNGVTKRFGDVLALDDLSLTVEEGETYGFLGPNGAGKSTTINVLLDFVRPTEGSATVLGYDAQEQSEAAKQNIGVLPEGYRVYERLTARKHLDFVMDSKEVDDDADAILDRVGLSEAKNRRAGGFSKGMRQRLVLGMALVGEPDLLVLDEPTSGLDPNGAREMREIVREENERGATVFFSSHILGQVEAVCDRVGVLDEGRMIAEGSLDDLRDRLGAEATMDVTLGGNATDVVAAVDGVSGVTSATADGDVLSVGLQNAAKMDALRAVDDTGATVLDVETRKESLESLFAELTDEDGTDGATAPEVGVEGDGEEVEAR